jgi:hypothetical protein
MFAFLAGVNCPNSKEIEVNAGSAWIQPPKPIQKKNNYFIQTKSFYKGIKIAQSSKQNEDWAIFIYIQQIYIETIVIFQIFVYL